MITFLLNLFCTEVTLASVTLEGKGTTEDEMAGWHHWLNGRESGWTLGVGDGQGGLACCDSWGRKESDTTEQLNWTEHWLITLYMNVSYVQHYILYGLYCVLSRSVLSNSLWPHGLVQAPLWPSRLLYPWNFSGKNTGVGCHILLQGIWLFSGPGMEAASLALAGRFFTTCATWDLIYS